MNELTNKNFAVLGLGRFGVSVVKTLSEYDVDVLACDKDPARLHEATPYATHVIQVDLNDEIALQQLGLGNFDVVILAMGEDFEASILTTMMAKEQGRADCGRQSARPAPEKDSGGRRRGCGDPARIRDGRQGGARTGAVEPGPDL